MDDMHREASEKVPIKCVMQYNDFKYVAECKWNPQRTQMPRNNT